MSKSINFSLKKRLKNLKIVLMFHFVKIVIKNGEICLDFFLIRHLQILFRIHSIGS